MNGASPTDDSRSPSLPRRLLRRFAFVKGLERKIRRLEEEKARLEAEMTPWWRFVPPGDSLSPVPSASDIERAAERRVFDPRLQFPGIDLDEAEQLELGKEFAAYYPEHPFPEEPEPGRRYHLNNPAYGYHDGIFLYCMLRHLKPRRVVEIGSGFSSAAMLDINSLAMGDQMRLTFVDPDMSHLRPLLRDGDGGRATLIERPVQELPLELFSQLEANDVLFIDSSHVSKIDSDVNRLFFEVFPVLRPGVHVHLHDVPGNLEYPQAWLEEGRAWNEVYLLRAFLMYNRAFRIRFFSMWFYTRHHLFLRERMPDCVRGGGGQIWLRRQPAGEPRLP